MSYETKAKLAKHIAFTTAYILFVYIVMENIIK